MQQITSNSESYDNTIDITQTKTSQIALGQEIDLSKMITPADAYFEYFTTAVDPNYSNVFHLSDEDILDIESRIYEQKKEEYLSAHQGKYIAQLGGELIDWDDDFSSLAKKVYDKHGYITVFITQVLRDEKVHKLSPKFI